MRFISSTWAFYRRLCYWMQALHHTFCSAFNYLLSAYSWDFLINFFAFMLNAFTFLLSHEVGRDWKGANIQPNESGGGGETERRNVRLTNNIYHFERAKTMEMECQLKKIESSHHRQADKKAHTHTPTWFHCFRGLRLCFPNAHFLLPTKSGRHDHFSMQICGTSVRNG